MAKHPKQLGRSLLAGQCTVGELRKLTKRFKIAKHYIGDALATYANDSVIVDGDLEVRGDLDTSIQGLCRLVVAGSLRVSGLYRDHDYPETAVFVLGDLEAERAITGGALAVAGDVRVRESLVGFYNDHSAEILGSVTAEVFVPENHFFTIGGALSARHVIGRDADHRVPAKLKKAATPVTDTKLRELLVPNVLEVFEDDPDDPEINLDHAALRVCVAAGKPILRTKRSVISKPARTKAPTPKPARAKLTRSKSTRSKRR